MTKLYLAAQTADTTYAKNSVWTMRTTIITADEADRSVEASSWAEASVAEVSEEAASAEEVSVVVASEAVVPEVNSNPQVLTPPSANYSMQLFTLKFDALHTIV